MKKALDGGNLREALKFSSNMLAELKTSRLTPRNYFNLCKSPGARRPPDCLLTRAL